MGEKLVTEDAELKRKFSIILGIGIFLFPYIFSWFTLRKSYSQKIRLISFIWLFLCMLFIAIPHNTTTSTPREKTILEKKAIDAQTPSNASILNEQVERDRDYIKNYIGEEIPFNEKLTDEKFNLWVKDWENGWQDSDNIDDTTKLHFFKKYSPRLNITIISKKDDQILLKVYDGKYSLSREEGKSLLRDYLKK